MAKEEGERQGVEMVEGKMLGSVSCEVQHQ